jgi:hypothetical protein
MIRLIDRRAASANSVELQDAKQLVELILGMRDAKGVCEVVLSDRKLLIGISPLWGFVQQSPLDDGPPYKMAVVATVDRAEGDYDFALDGGVTSVPLRYCLSSDVVVQMVTTFFETGTPPPDQLWEEI